MLTIWQNCIDSLRAELSREEFGTWIAPLKVDIHQNVLKISAPNRFISDWVRGKFLARITEIVNAYDEGEIAVRLGVQSEGENVLIQPSEVIVGASSKVQKRERFVVASEKLGDGKTQNDQVSHGFTEGRRRDSDKNVIKGRVLHRGALNSENNFENFVIGK